MEYAPEAAHHHHPRDPNDATLTVTSQDLYVNGWSDWDQKDMDMYGWT